MKTKLKPRRLWANAKGYSDDKPAAKVFSRRKFDYDDLPVAVVPLDDVEGLVDKGAWDMRQSITLDDATYAEAFRVGLESIGVLPKQRKKGGRA